MKHLLTVSFILLPVFCMAQKISVGKFKFDPVQLTGHSAVKNQNQSATCWSFASNSFLESELMRLGKKDVDLSEMYIARYSMKRKIARHLQLKGQNYFTPGGQFHDVIWVLKNYGIVPEISYPGKMKSSLNHDHGELDTLLSHFVQKMLKAGVTSLNQQQNRYVDSVLDHYLGPVPAQVYQNGKRHTPQSYLKEVLAINPDDYIEITSYTHHPYYSSFVLEDKYNWTADAYYNVPLDDFSGITDYALAKGYSVEWDGDVDDPDFNYSHGLAFLSETINDYPAYRQKAFEEESTKLDHMMHIVGFTKDNSGNKWYYVKNSWGDRSNALGGYLYMREDYFKIRTVAIIVNKQAIPPSVRKKMNL